MRAFILLGSVLPVLFVLGYPESTASLEGRDLPSPHSVQPVQQLSKRTTSLPNLVVCPGPDDHAFDMNNFNKMLTALVRRKAPCVYFANMAMAVFDRNGGPAAFTDSEPSYIRNWYDSQLSQQCQAQRPVMLRSKLPPIRPDDFLRVGTAFYKEPFPSEQVINCNEEDEAAVRNFLSPYASQN